jgi:hypothetical protein
MRLVIFTLRKVFKHLLILSKHKKTIQHFHDGDCVHIYKRIFYLSTNSKVNYFCATNLLSYLIDLTYAQEDLFFLFFLY